MAEHETGPGNEHGNEHGNAHGRVDGTVDGTADDAAAGTDGARAKGLRVLGEDTFSFADAVGGVRGVVESTLPGLVFVIGYLVVGELRWPLVAAVATALGAVVVRLVQRTPATQAFSGVVGVVIGVVWAWRSGEAQDFYTWGLLVNAGWFLAALVSILVRWPAVGVIVALLRDQGTGWRTDQDPDAVHLRRRYTWATWVWVAVFGARLAVQVPMWLQGESAIGWLGTARLAMGVPLFALGIWITWLLVASRGARAESARRQRPRTR